MKYIPNAFDLVVLAALVFGLIRGRKAGMSGELLPLLRWAAIVVAGAYAYLPLSQWLKPHLGVGVAWSRVIAYLAIGAGVLFITGLLKKKVGEKLVSQELFGRGEFYLGMAAGAVHHALILIAALALLNAAYYTPAQIEASRKQAEQDLGSDFFGWAHPARIQRTAFQQSLVGPQIKTHVGHLLISPVRTGQAVSAETLGQRTDRQMTEILGR